MLFGSLRATIPHLLIDRGEVEHGMRAPTIRVICASTVRPRNRYYVQTCRAGSIIAEIVVILLAQRLKGFVIVTPVDEETGLRAIHLF